MNPSPVSMRLWLCGGILLGLFFGGCSAGKFNATEEQRQAALKPRYGEKIGGISSPEYIARRSALLIRSELATYIPKENSGGDLVLSDKKRSFDLGTASAIDSRGYYLTAGHCTDQGAPYLFLYERGKTRLTRSRLVWRGIAAKDGPDLALLHVDSRLRDTFSWSPGLRLDEKIIVMGAALKKGPTFINQFSAGKILSLPPQPKTNPPVLAFCHDAPISQGDSGGPVVDRSGKLLGVTTTLVYSFQFTTWSGRQVQAGALRPDLSWLKRKIDADHSAWLKLKSQAKPPSP